MESCSQTLHRAVFNSLGPRSLRQGPEAQKCLSDQNRWFPSLQKRPLPPPSSHGNICNFLVSNGGSNLISRGRSFQSTDHIFLSQRKIGDRLDRMSPVGPARVQCRASSAPKTVPEQHLAQVVAEETTVRTALCQVFRFQNQTKILGQERPRIVVGVCKGCWEFWPT